MAVKTPTEKCIPIGALADTGGAGGTLIVKASKFASQMNHRLYRQTRNYSLKFSLQALTAADDHEIGYDFYTLPNNWFVHGAIKYAYRTYMQAHQDELDAGIKFSRWSDFTIDEQNPDGTWEQSQVFLYDGDGFAAISGDQEHVDSSITLADGSTSKSFRLLGTDSGAFNIFREYANMLKYRTSADTSVSSSQPYDGLLDLKDADKMAEDGDRPPYDSDFATILDDGTDDQNILVYQDSIVYGRTSHAKLSTRFFTAPLGLVFVRKIKNGAADDVSNTVPELCLHLQKGNYKGINAPSLL
ncbi:MAG: putative capsid protein [Cressdnaviricota sp.]|nr:MAG: putative capsid protein [Cressdnaviricota sp.]